MDICDCNSEIPISFSEDNPCQLTLFPVILSNCNSMMMCATKTIQATNRLNEKNSKKLQITPVRATSTILLLPLRKKHGVIRNNSGNSTERTTKVSQLNQYFIQLYQHKIYIIHTILIAQTQIRRESPLFIRRFSNWAFSNSLTDWHKQTIWCPVACTTVAAGFNDELI